MCETHRSEVVVEPEDPSWFHPAGRCMGIDTCNSNEIIFSSQFGSKLHITRMEAEDLFNQYRIEWNVIHSRYERVNGIVLFPREIVLSAFGLIDPVPFAFLTMPGFPQSTRTLILSLEPDFYAEGKCIRKGNYLSIPGFRLISVGDSNLSLYITSEIRDQMALFMDHKS
jgi:hypothetical protein